MGSLVKMLAVYPTPFWQTNGMSGLVISTTEVNGTLFPACMDTSPLGGAAGVLTCLCAGECALDLLARPVGDRQLVLTDFLARALGAEALAPLKYLDHDWGAD